MVNAVYARHIGNPMLLQNTYNEIIDYINKNNLQPITAAYNVTISDIREGQALYNFIVDDIWVLIQISYNYKFKLVYNQPVD